MRLLVITNRYPVSDADSASPFVRDFCYALIEAGCRLKVLTPHYPEEDLRHDPWLVRFPWADSDRVIGQLSLREPSGLARVVRAITAGRRATLELARTWKPDFALALWALPSGYWARAAAAKLGVRYGVWCLGSDIQVWGRRPLVRNLVRSVLRRADLRYADGYALAAETEQLAGLSCAFLPSLRRLPDAPGEPLRHPWSKKRYFLFLGRLSADKGVLDLLDAAARLEGGPEFGIVFAGIPDRGLDLPAQIAARRLERTCHAIGHLEASELRSWIGHAEAVLLPSHHDSIPLVFGEAVQAGTPVICSDLPDFTAVLQRYRLGTTVPVRRPDALAAALARFVAPEAFQRERSRFLADFSPASAALRFLGDVRVLRGVPASAPEAPRVREAVHA
jgi:glycosyltransferase involved in cell wall biosynthesis